MKLYNEFNEPLEPAESRLKDFSEIIFFTEYDEEPASIAEISVNKGVIKCTYDNLTEEQKEAVRSYAKEARKAIQKQNDYSEDIDNTEKWLSQNSKNW